MNSSLEAEARILIVDDAAENIKTLTTALKKKYKVTAAKSGEEALEILSGGELPDLILLDVVMPGLDGYEVCERIKQIENAKEVPVIFITEKTEEEDETYGFGLGAVDYIPKPFSLPVVEVRVATHVQLKKYKDYLEEMVARRTNELSLSHVRLEQTVRAYERFVPKEFLNLLDREDIINVGLGDNRVQDMAILFADIRNFTGHSELLGPEETFHFLNAYLGEVVPIIRKHGGVIDKYIGDAIMAVFSCTRGCAVTAAVEMQRALRKQNSAHQIGGNPVTVGIGIHYGEVMLGTIGEEERMETTVISDIVNLGSRLEELTKVYGADILVSEEVMERLEDREAFETRFLDVIQVRGKTIPVSIYEVLDGSDREVRDRKIAVNEDYKKGWDFFCDGRIDEAAEHFERVLAGNPGDRAAELFLGRCREYF